MTAAYDPFLSELKPRNLTKMRLLIVSREEVFQKNTRVESTMSVRLVLKQTSMR